MELSKIIFAIRYHFAVKKANRLHALHKRKYMVISLHGKPIVVSKKKLSQLVRLHKFKKGVKIQDIENKALYKTLI